MSIAVYEYDETKNNKLYFIRKSASSRCDADETIRIDKFIDGCEILEPTDKHFNFLDSLWNIKCSCGKIFTSKLHRIKYKTNKLPKSCGCKNIQRLKDTAYDYSNKEYNGCTVLSPVDSNNKSSGDYWNVKCYCGNIFQVTIVNLNGSTKSCGCYKREVSKNTCINMHKTTRINKGLKDNQYLTDASTFLRTTVFDYVRNIIRDLDKDTCLLCLKPYSYQVHHIIPISTIKNYRDINELEIVYNYKNLITLCKDCHDKAHNGYSKGLNLDIQKTLTIISNSRYISDDLLEKYNIAKTTINEIINNWMVTLNV